MSISRNKYDFKLKALLTTDNAQKIVGHVVSYIGLDDFASVGLLHQTLYRKTPGSY